jgi:hypothetical protein
MPKIQKKGVRTTEEVVDFFERGEDYLNPVNLISVNMTTQDQLLRGIQAKQVKNLLHKNEQACTLQLFKRKRDVKYKIKSDRG